MLESGIQFEFSLPEFAHPNLARPPAQISLAQILPTPARLITYQVDAICDIKYTNIPLERCFYRLSTDP